MNRIKKLAVPLGAAFCLATLSACTIGVGDVAEAEPLSPSVEDGLSAGLETTTPSVEDGLSAGLETTTPSVEESGYARLETTAFDLTRPIGEVVPNTNSVLFPTHILELPVIEAQMDSYVSTFRRIDPKQLSVKQLAYVRIKPGLFHESTDVLHPGDTIEVDGYSGSWYRLADDGGYVLATDLDDPKLPAGVVWAMNVVNEGDSETIDRCAGGLTEFKPMSRDLEVPAWTMHSYCGGEPILELGVGDLIAVNGDTYEVVTTNDFPLFGSTELMRNLPPVDAYLQVDDLVQGYSYVVGLSAMGGERNE